MQGDTGKIFFLFVEDIMMGGGFPKQMCTPHTAGIFHRSGHEISKPPPPQLLNKMYAAGGYRNFYILKFQCLYPLLNTCLVVYFASYTNTILVMQSVWCYD